MTRFGLIGCGNIARFHFAAIAKADGRVSFVADINEAAAKPWLAQTGAAFSTDYRDLVRSDDVDVVCVLASAPFHLEMCMAALAAGKDVVCEKTMANNPAEAAQLVAAVRESGRLFFTTYMKRFFPAVVKAQELLPQLGRVFAAHVRSYQCWGDFFSDGADAPEAVLRTYGGAVLKCAGSHVLDMTMFFLGRPQRVYAKLDCVPGTRFDRKVTSILEFENGVTATFEAAAHPLQKIGFARDSWDEKMEINGVNGRLEIYTVQWDAPERNAALLVHYDNDSGAVTEYRFDAVNPFDLEVEAIMRAVAGRMQIHPDVLDGFNVDALIGAMIDSDAAGASVPVDWRGL